MGASRDLSNTYRAQAPRIQEYADQIGGLTGGLIDRFRDGDPAVNAASNYITETLGSDPENNPYLDDMVSRTGDNVRRQIQTGLGTRGGIGGSVERDLVTRGLADSELGLRYQDYDRAQSRRAQAAGMAPGIAAADMIPLASAMQTANFGAMTPLQGALMNAAGQGGLLGQYQDVEGTQRTSGGFLGDLLLAGIGAAGSYFGGRG